MTSPLGSPGQAQAPRTSLVRISEPVALLSIWGDSSPISPHMCDLPGFRRDYDFGTKSQEARPSPFFRQIHPAHVWLLWNNDFQVIVHIIFLLLYLCSLSPEVARIMLYPIPNPILCYHFR